MKKNVLVKLYHRESVILESKVDTNIITGGSRLLSKDRNLKSFLAHWSPKTLAAPKVLGLQALKFSLMT